jgi:phosphoenolpyruvate-protein phosphotransferase
MPHIASPSRRLRGIAAAPGMAEGPAALWHEVTLEIPRQTECDPQAEKGRLDQARQRARAEIAELTRKVAQDATQVEAAVFEAHAMFLDDVSLLDRAQTAIGAGSNAEAAWMDAVEFFAGQLAAIPDPTLSARAADVRDVGTRVLGHLLGRALHGGLALERPSVVVARDLVPSQTASLDKQLVRGFCTAEGGPTSHTAILARALGLPAVVGLGAGVLTLGDGTPLLVDGERGEVIADPDKDETRAFAARRRDGETRGEAERARASEPAVTRDGHRVEVVSNVGSPEDAQAALTFGAEGIGLLRTEFLYLERQTAPSEDEQVAAYDAILDIMGERPVVVRTLDVGGDKALPYLDLGHEANPFLGWRAIRMCLDRPEFFRIQLRALLRAGAGHDLRIMFPMVSTLDEVRRTRPLLDEARAEVQRAGHPMADAIQIGIMVEVPSVAVLADQFAREVDFFSIGTNDLTQYTMAAERTNNRVARLSDALHPAVLRQIRSVIDAGHDQGIWIGVCGELAGEPDAVPILLGLGLDEFSIAPPLIPRAKAIIRRWSLEAARRVAAEALDLDSPDAVRALLRSRQPE